MSVKYQVERRPIAANGKVYRGTGIGDYVLTLTHPDNIRGISATSKSVLRTHTYATLGASTTSILGAFPSISVPLGREAVTSDGTATTNVPTYQVSAIPQFIPAGISVPSLTSSLDTASGTKVTAEAVSHVQEVNGEPWLVHSTHFSIESALESAAPLAGAIGQENVRIIKVLSHTTTFKLL